MKIRPYDIIQLKNENFFLIRNIEEIREIKGSFNKTLYAKGYFLSKEKYTIKELQKIDLKKLIQNQKEENLECINVENEIKAIISNKTKIEWRLSKKVQII